MSCELMCCYMCICDVRGDLTLNSIAQIHTSVTRSHVQLCSAHAPARLSHFVRRDLRVECSSDIFTSCFQKWTKCLLKKCANGPFYDTKSPDYRDQHMIANTWEEIGKELKIKCMFYVFICMCIFISAFI